MRKILSNWHLNEPEVVGQFHSDTVKKIYKIHSDGQDYLIKGIPESVPESEIRSNVQAHLFLGNEKKIALEIFSSILDTLPDFSEYDQCLIHSDIGPHNAIIRSNGEAVFIVLNWRKCF